MTNRLRWPGRFIRDQIERTDDLSNRVLDGTVLPSWMRETAGEPRLVVTVAMLAALGMQVMLPSEVQLKHSWILPSVAAILLVITIAANPRRMTRISPTVRLVGLAMIGSIGMANLWSGTRLVNQLLTGRSAWESGSARTLLLTGGAIWLTNVIVFALAYWEFDRGGAVARAHGSARYPDFLFPQMQNAQLSRPSWAPQFVDYMYLSFTNASAFSAADVQPLSRWAKTMMMTQAAISLVTVVLVISRAVSII